MVSAHLKLALTWINLLNARDGPGLASVMADNFTANVRPASLGFPPIVGVKPYIDNLLNAPIRNFSIALPQRADIVESPEHVMFYTKAINGTTSHGFPWTTEYVFTFNFAGDKIAGTVEFVDATLVLGAFNNEAIAAKAELNCKN